MTRRFVTRATVDAAIARGETTMELPDVVTVTDEAAARARERGLVFLRDGAAVAGRPTAASAAAPVAPAAEGGPARGTGGSVDRTAVRRAVIGVLGRVPPELDEVLDRVLGPGAGGR